MNIIRFAWLNRFSGLHTKVFFCRASFAFSMESTPGAESSPTLQGENKKSHPSPSHFLLIHRTHTRPASSEAGTRCHSTQPHALPRELELFFLEAIAALLNSLIEASASVPEGPETSP